MNNPKDQQEREDLHDQILALVVGFFKDEKKAQTWMETENPNLGGSTPATLIHRGRGHKVLQFVTSALEENHP